MQLIYLAGCYTKHPRGLPRFIGTPLNVFYAWRVAFYLWRRGFYVLCPMTNTAFMDRATSYEAFMQGCFETIKAVDTIVMLPNFIYSSGAKRELELAVELGKTVALFYDDTSLARRAWLDLRDRNIDPLIIYYDTITVSLDKCY